MIDLSLAGGVADNPAAGLTLEVVSFEDATSRRLPVLPLIASLVEVRPAFTSSWLSWPEE